MKMINDSCIMKFVNYMFDFFKKIFSKSKIVNFFVTNSERNIDEYLSSSLLYKFFIKIIEFIKGIIYKLKIEKYLSNSIFTNNLFWLCLVMIGIPLLPTYILLIISFISFMSLILRCCIDDKFKIRKNKVDYLVVGFIICIVVVSILSYTDINLIKMAIVNIVYLLNYFVAVNSIRTKKDLDKILNCFLIIGLFVSLYGLYQYFYGNLSLGSGWVDTATFNNIDKRMIGTFNNPIFLGEYLIFYALVCFGFFTNAKGFKKLSSFICFIISCFCILLTYSRACFLGLALALLLMMFISNRKSLIFLVVVILLGLVIGPDSIMDRIFSIGNLGESSTSYRVAMWDGSLIMLGKYWFSGIGYGDDNFIRAITHYSYSYFYIHTEHPHNLILTIFSGLGLPGLLTFLIMFILYFKKGISSYVKFDNSTNKDNEKLRVLNLSIMCGILGLFVVSIFDHTLYKYSIMLLHFIMMGLGVGITNVLEESCNET